MTAKKKTARKKTARKETARKNLNKTQATRVSVAGFLAEVEHPIRRKDAQILAKLFRRVSGKTPRMWGPTIVGYGEYHYKYASGREGDGPRIGFSPRRQSLVLYIMAGFDGSARLLARLGKHKTSVACLYVNKLDDIDFDVLEKLVVGSWREMERRYPTK